MAESESVDDVKARHKKELKALDGTGRKLIKQANKNKKKVAEAEAKIAQLDVETKDRHRRELEEASKAAAASEPTEEVPPSSPRGEKDAPSAEKPEAAGGGDCDGGGDTVVDKVAADVGAMSVEDREREKRDLKRAKAQRKREKQREKEKEREQRIAKEKEEGGPDPRIIEMDVLNTQVAPRGFRVSEIKADGHCLYRAVAEQLALTGRRPSLTEESYDEIRRQAASELRSSPDDYLPFLDGLEPGPEFELYCGKVEGSAEWGGQIELQALCSSLEVPIEVFSAMSPPLRLGEQFEGPPLLLTYHEHYYALGAHYNSVVPLNS